MTPADPNDWYVSAPGKLFLGGEYAVLEGAEAIVTAVDRHARATIVDHPVSESTVVNAARQTAAEELEKELGERETPQVSVTSSGFQIGRQKIGLGSSAAACASAVGALFEWVGVSIESDRNRVLRTAVDAHTKAQGGRGSGADVAAAVHGGTFVFRDGEILDELDVSKVELVAVWSGRAASTTELISHIVDFSRRDPSGHRALMGELGQGAQALARAYRTGRPGSIIAATRDYGLLMDRLGRQSKAPIVTPQHRLMSQLASDLGGAAKPSGAGGGDVALGVFEDHETGATFSRYCLRHELTPLEIKLDAEGLTRVLRRVNR